MLQNIKSLYYFNKKLFSLIEEGKKLELIKYNKNLQKNLNINLTNYRYFSGRYIIYESKGRGKEYNWYDDTLRYEGEYLNGKKNGKGKEYDYSGKLTFEGEYLNGKKRGKGKEYNYDDNLIFEGEYLEGIRNGKGKEYFEKTGNLKFEGEYLNGMQWKGKGYDKDGNIIYELNNSNENGKEYNCEGILFFEGEYLNGKKKWKRKRIQL